MSRSAAAPAGSRRTAEPTTAPRAAAPVAAPVAVLAAALVAVALVVTAALAGGPSRRGAPPPAPGAAPRAATATATAPDAWADGVVTEADGVLPEGTSAEDGQHPGVANLDPALLAALRAATAHAAEVGVELEVNSGWRSPEHQERLLAEAVAEHGAQEAARWVATAETSGHVSGDAVDVGPPAAAAWLSEHGAEHGLCRTYRNEPWHFELRPAALEHGCPAPYADAAQDPRTRR
ncbi:D-alanyl-D-alanine carboxypeptidase family protein [Kineococcus gypseus]|uniref:D-alanyl-D-alanine carboxypeptidase family protein n=1 Tax=Kineococcus gypseus TaxID=1637102 RepID=UPI003D7EFA17